MAGDAASFVLSRLPHPDTPASAGVAFVDSATGASLSFAALRRAALSLASGLRLGLGLRRGDAVLVLAPHNSLLLPQILLGVLAAGGVVVVAAADPDATAAEISAAARASGAVIAVAAPEVAGKVAGAGVPLLLTSLDPRTLSAEELIDGADATALPVEEQSSSDDVAFVAYSSSSASASKTVVAVTHADLIAAAADVGAPGEGSGNRVICLASLPMCSLHGLSLLVLGLPAAGATTVLMPPLPSHDPRAAVARHGATDIVATPEAAAVLAAPMLPQDGKLSTLRRVVVVAPVPLPAEARLEFRRRLPWVELTELNGTPEKEAAMPATATQEVPRRKRMQKIILGDIFSRLNISRNLTRTDPETSIRQAASKL